MNGVPVGPAGRAAYATFDRRGVRVGSGPLGSGQGGMGRCRR
ncbi:sulfate adenylyltransferase [Streptomyces chumphonensis]|uniref:Sulfate adenylyltransferase n=1 Tax=Streptomyces chumphonensis TaxID=1214925 RepID=A0A927EWI2_9ACTN|nr:hypothetical protein [Streptomyces chumphonensis]MBD3931389.1 sulfate adenylyltransferase [Streptomyces chumphonensis]